MLSISFSTNKSSFHFFQVLDLRVAFCLQFERLFSFLVEFGFEILNLLLRGIEFFFFDFEFFLVLRLKIISRVFSNVYLYC